MKTTRGFTLIEVMIVVAIVGILAAIALPAISPHHKGPPVPVESTTTPTPSPCARP